MDYGWKSLCSLVVEADSVKTHIDLFTAHLDAKCLDVEILNLI